MKTKENNYSRRSFIKLAGGAALAGLLQSPAAGMANHRVSKAVSKEVNRMLLNEEDRTRYVLRLLEKLCTDLGPRPTGSAQYAQGARIIKEEMQRFLPLVEYDNYLFDQWEPIGEAEFFVGEQYIETYLAAGSPGTPSSGITGILEQTGTRFRLIDPLTKEIKALIVKNGYGRAIPVDYKGNGNELNVPQFMIGMQDVPLIERAIQNQPNVRLKGQVRFLKDSKGINIVGQLPGKTRDEILFVAHADTMYTSPGAIDNTTSVIVMLMLADALAGSELKHTLTFLATDAEEYGYLGAKHYAGKRTANDTMKNIRYVINFDSIAWGPNLWINSLDDEIKTMIQSVHNDLNLNTTPIFKHQDGFVMDSESFRPSGAKAMHVNSRGYDEKTLPLYHRPDDDAQRLPLDCCEIAFQVFNEYIKRIDKL